MEIGGGLLLKILKKGWVRLVKGMGVGMGVYSKSLRYIMYKTYVTNIMISTKNSLLATRVTVS